MFNKLGDLVLFIADIIIKLVTAVLLGCIRMTGIVYRILARQGKRTWDIVKRSAYIVMCDMQFLLPIAILIIMRADYIFYAWYIGLMLTTWLVKQIAVETNNAYTSIPIPRERFTQTDDGEVSIDQSRVNELLIYVADLEDYLERKGYM